MITDADVEDAIAQIEAAVLVARTEDVDRVELVTTVRGAETVVLALKSLHRDAPALSLLPGEIVGDALMSMRLGKLSELIDRLGPLVVSMERGS